MQFRQPYDPKYNPMDYATPVGYDPTQPDAALEASLTEQSFKDECDINNIVKQYERTGLMPHQRPNQPVFADISDAPSFLEAQNVVAAANEAFAAIPARDFSFLLMPRVTVPPPVEPFSESFLAAYASALFL